MLSLRDSVKMCRSLVNSGSLSIIYLFSEFLIFNKQFRVAYFVSLKDKIPTK